MATGLKQNDDDVEMSAPMMKYSHCDSYYVNRTKFTYFSVYDGLPDTLLVNVLVFLVSFTFTVLYLEISVRWVGKPVTRRKVFFSPTKSNELRSYRIISNSSATVEKARI